MSIAEFYIENCLDPSDPDHMDKFLSSHAFLGDDYYQVQEQVERETSSRTAASSWPMNESELDYMAETRGWDKVEGLPAQPPMASYRKDGIRLNFWLSTGTVGSYLDHPRQGKTQLFRRQISMSDASEIFNNPRQHTGKGYHTTTKNNPSNNRKKRKADAPATYMRTCSSCGSSKSNDDFSKNQRRKGASAKCKSCV